MAADRTRPRPRPRRRWRQRPAFRPRDPSVVAGDRRVDHLSARDRDYALVGGLSYSRDDILDYLQGGTPCWPGWRVGQGRTCSLPAWRRSRRCSRRCALGTCGGAARAVFRHAEECCARRSSRWAYAVTYVDASDIDAIAAAVRPGETQAGLCRNPGEPRPGAVTDIAAAAEVAHRRRPRSWRSTPRGDARSCPGRSSTGQSGSCIRRPSYLNGHSDVLAGAIVTAAGSDERWEQIGLQRALNAPVLGPFEAFLLLRGMRTLFPQVRAEAFGHGESDRPPVTVEHNQAGAPGSALSGGLAAFPGHCGSRGRQYDGWVTAGCLSLRLAGGRGRLPRHAVES